MSRGILMSSFYPGWVQTDYFFVLGRYRLGIGVVVEVGVEVEAVE